MDMSVSPQLESSLNDTVTDGEENHSEAGSSPASSTQVLIGEDSAVTLVQLSDGQTAQVQGVIQAPQNSVIQAPQVQTAQIATVAELEDDESASNTQKRREILSRRPSYRKILNELSSDSPAVPKIEEEKGEDEAPVSSSPSASLPNSIYQTSSGQFSHIIIVLKLLIESLTWRRQVKVLPGAKAFGTGLFWRSFCISVLVRAATGDIPAYQLRSPNSGLAQSIVMAASPSSMQSPSSQHAEEVTRKREVRLMKNREAARECRRKKKEYVKCLENRVAVLENQNKTLIEELKALKDIYCHKSE
ncbi:transcript variant X1 [Nothobranchius furzeri]|uniref:Transcript variant X1 n=1 Tax=Nothobranchius furzeri TaxID=105023 RepID=A0A9D3BXF3_NOTFU|nr:transcript variant X1 [Nothobranchius furzeri]